MFLFSFIQTDLVLVDGERRQDISTLSVFQIYLVQNEEQDGERLMEKGLIRSV